MSLLHEPYNVDGEKIGAQSLPGRLAQTAIALFESENVIKRALEMVGTQNLRPTLTTSLDEVYISVKKALSVRQEGLSDIVRVKFRHHDPKLAVAFTNAVVESFTARYLQLYRNSSDAVLFFLEQQKRNRLALERASAALQEFASANRVFKIDDQIRLLIEERSHVASTLGKTRGLITEKESQTLAIPTQLSQMKPINRLPQITGLTPSKPDKVTTPHVDNPPKIEALGADPPLLLVRVYQDTIANLVRLQTELVGLHALELYQDSMLKKLDDELSSIVSKEAQFDRLRQEVVNLRANDEILTKKLTELQVSQDLNAKKLSSVQVIQDATTPLEPMQRWVLTIGLGVCIAPFLAMALLRADRNRKHEV